MQPICFAYATHLYCILCNPAFCICNPAIAYATHTQKLKGFFYTLEEQGPMKLMWSNLYDASMMASVQLDSFDQFWARYARKFLQNHRNFHQNHTNPKSKMSGCQWSITYFIFSKIHEKLRENGQKSFRVEPMGFPPQSLQLSVGDL